MKIPGKRQHVGVWVLLLVLAIQSTHTIPLRQRYFASLPNLGFDPWVIFFYVSIMPVLAGALYLLFCTYPWTFNPNNRWYCPRLNLRGLLIQILACLSVLAIDRAGFLILFPGIQPPSSILADFGFTMGVLLVTGFLAVTISGLDQAREANANCAREAQEALVEARARLIAAQIDPHVLFNVFGGIGSLIDENPEQAKVMVSAASGYLKKLLTVTKSERIALGQEREMIAEYLEVEHFRMGDRLTVEWDWTAEFDALMVPPILVQPLVENAIKHGLWPNRKGGALRIKAERAGTDLMITVENTGMPLAADFREGGIGLANIRSRLQYSYGGHARFTLVPRGEWTVATIAIPLETPCVF